MEQAALQWNSLKLKANFAPRDLVVEMCVRLSLRVPGNIVEFGVYEGDSARAIRRALNQYGRRLRPGFYPNKAIFALDSFKGLPEKFENADAGTFACEPPRIPGVEIVKGYFEDTLTPEFARRVGRVAFAHLDADLYSSTLCALNFLAPLLDTGSLLLFDEFIGGDGAERKALEDWFRNTGVDLLQVAEFSRDPSGWGAQMDKRVVFQLVGAGEIEPLIRPVSFKAKVYSYLRKLGLASPGAIVRGLCLSKDGPARRLLFDQARRCRQTAWPDRPQQCFPLLGAEDEQ